VTEEGVNEYLGPTRFRWELAGEADEVGWRRPGGDCDGGRCALRRDIRCSREGRLILTGKLGEVMQESAQAALTYARHARVC